MRTCTEFVNKLQHEVGEEAMCISRLLSCLESLLLTVKKMDIEGLCQCIISQIAPLLCSDMAVYWVVRCDTPDTPCWLGVGTGDHWEVKSQWALECSVATHTHTQSVTQLSAPQGGWDFSRHKHQLWLKAWTELQGNKVQQRKYRRK